MRELDFYFDIYSPYAYLGFHRLLHIAADHPCRIAYHPVDLPLLKRAAGNTGPANTQIPPKIKYLMTDLKRWADRYDLPFGSIPKGNNYARINSGVFYAAERGAAAGYIAQAYALAWGRGGDVDDDNELKALAHGLGWDSESYLQYVNSTDASTAFQRSNQAAIDRGVFGVPTVMLGDEMWWGNDRLDFLEERLQVT